MFHAQFIWNKAFGVFTVPVNENMLFLSLQHRDVFQLCLRLGSLFPDGGEMSHSAPELCRSLVHYTLLRLK